ncbi:MAG: secretin N-terminal domain-containing protein, partial [Candidatus Omnitrophota bacterium]
VAASDVEGKVNIRLVDVPWQTALEVIVKNQGLSYEKIGNIIRVVTLASVAVEELQNEIFVLNYSKAKDVATAIEDTLSERGKVKFDERTNTLIVTDIPTNLYKIKQVVERLDRRTPQIAIEAKIIETTLDEDENLGISWTIEASATGAGIPTTMPFKRTGSHFSSKATDSLTPYLPLATTGFPTSTIPAFPYVNASLFTFGTLDFSEMSAVLEILSQRTDTKIISSPHTVTLDNQEATINIGYSLYIPVWSESATTGRPVFSGVSKTELDTGIMLTVTPHVNQAGDIVVDLAPKISSRLTKELLVTATADTPSIYAYPISVREARTQVMVRDGQTIVIGGMVSETNTKVRRKVPILGDIPILGELFKKTEDGVETTDLLIFVTVKLLDDSVDDSLLMEETETKAIRASEDEVKFDKIDKK